MSAKAELKAVRVGGNGRGGPRDRVLGSVVEVWAKEGVGEEGG